LSQESVRYQRNPDYIFRKIVDELVLVPIRQNVADMDCIFTMNAIGAFVWERLDGQTALSDLLVAITDEYEVDADVAAADLEQFLGEMAAAGAITKA
jgi:hypothetical protein